MEKLEEFITSELNKYPKSDMPDCKFDYGYEIITSTKPVDLPGEVIFVSVCKSEKLEETHIKQLKRIIKKHPNEQCYVRVMPETFEEARTGGKGIYSRLQFKVVKPDEPK